VSVSRARTEFSSLLARAESGEEIGITRRGTPVARLIGLPRPRPRTMAEVIEAIRQDRKGRTLGGLTTKDLINEGRKY
jgi:prevent-host-death family protein